CCLIQGPLSFISRGASHISSFISLYLLYCIYCKLSLFNAILALSTVLSLKIVEFVVSLYLSYEECSGFELD
ncbi:hypothetical protein, partial [Xylanibacter caecicola]|uniref:hypothetical protein n=1 Tax=Xylanibacter caecicola TaxID=2736294 RepID=UPI00259CC55A